MKYNYFIVIVLSMLVSNLFAQNQREIRIIDIETNLPINEATYEYGVQTGLTDEDGILRISFEDNVPIYISHLSYGSWKIDGVHLEKALSDGVYYRKKEMVNLYPVTIIAVQSQNNQIESKLDIEYQDRMEHDAAEVLNRLPAFNSIRKGSNYGFDPVFRGFKYDQLNIVLNGSQSATAACPNRMDPPTSQMAPNMIDRIEIFKGPYALRYGSGFGATINFIPTNLRFSSSKEVYGRVSLGYVNNGSNIKSEGQIGLSGKRYDLSFFSSWSEGDDYTTGNDEKIKAGYQRGSFGTNIGIKINSDQQLKFSATYNRARDTDFAALPMDLRDDDTWLFNARHDVQFGNRNLQSWSTTVFGSFVDHTMDNLLKPLDPRKLNAKTDAETYNYGGRTEGVWNLQSGKLYAGLDLRSEGAKGIREREFLIGPNAGKTFTENAWQDGKITTTGIFAEYQVKGTLLDYIFSGRLNMNQADVESADEEFIELYGDVNITQVNPSFSVGFLKELSSKINTGLWIGRAARSGSLTERYINFFAVGQDPYEMVGNPSLDAEINNQIDLTLEYNISKQSKINFDLFASYLQDYISSVIDTSLSPTLPFSPGVRKFVNIEEGFKTGFEINWYQTLFSGIRHQLGIAYTYGQDLEREEPLPEIAPLDIRYVLSGVFLNDKLNPELAIRYAGKQSRISEEFGESETPSFVTVDFKLRYGINSRLSCQLGVNNLFDNDYYEHLNRSVRGKGVPIYASGRSVFANASYRF